MERHGHARSNFHLVAGNMQIIETPDTPLSLPDDLRSLSQSVEAPPVSSFPRRAPRCATCRSPASSPRSSGC